MSNFGISNVIVIVTKMNLIHYDQAQFSAIETFIETEIATKRYVLAGYYKNSNNNALFLH
jgi:translation elongation factor EF-1alpha